MNKTENVQAIAHIQVVVEVYAKVWGHDCTIGQIHDQAGREGMAKVQSLISNQGAEMRIIGEPKVTGVITERAK